MCLLNLFSSIIEPVTVVMTYNMFNNTKDKYIKRNNIQKNFIAFIILYTMILFKKIALDKGRMNLFSMLIAIAPIVTVFILPKIIYKVDNCHMINRALLTFFCLSLMTDCFVLLSYQGNVSEAFNSSKEQLYCLIAKVLQLIILKWLLKAIQYHVPEIVHIAICVFLIIMLNFISEFILKAGTYKLFVLIIEFILLGFIYFSLNHLLKKMLKYGTLRGLRHDEKSHYALMIDMLRNNKMEEFESYRREINFVLDDCRYCNCDNFVIASVINATMAKASNNEINFQYKIETSRLPINLFEQNTILRNVLNNAIESCLYCPSDRFINFHISRNRYGETKIRCENSSLDSNRNYYVSSKSNRKQHGLGLRNVQSIIHKNNGNLYCKYDHEEKTFLTTITLKR